ncbi:MAG: tetratricopeptide repeat protein [Phycisphaerae bacterium]
MSSGVDILLITAAEGEDDAVREVDAGGLGQWTETPGPDGYGFKIWVRDYRTATGRPLRIALTRAFQMGAAASGNAAGRLTDFFKPQCLAMCGVCAGRPGWTNLGDVIVADRVWSYDAGELVRAKPGAKPVFHSDTFQHPLRLQWTQAAQSFVPPTRDRLLRRRPRSRELQTLWLLKQLLDGKNPGTHTSRATMCANWGEIIAELETQSHIKRTAGQLELTEAGREFIQNELAKNRGRLPRRPPWKIHVGPLGTGTRLIRDVDIWSFLEDQQRLVRGFDMEASVIGMTALLQDVPRMIVVKGVMDYGLPDRHRGFRPFAARAAAEVLIAFLREHLEPRKGPEILKAHTRPLPATPSPATLLNATYEAVSFNRDACVALWNDLDAWCTAPDAISVRLVVGPGGSGKTRLFIEFAHKLCEKGWQAGFWPEGAPLEDLETVLASPNPTLIVIDYAEARPELAKPLKVIAERGDGSTLRVVLLAREVADWWHSLRQRDAAVEDLLMRHSPTAVAAVPVEGPLRQQLFEQARARFSKLRGQQQPLTPVDLTDERFGRVLYLQMAALAVVDGLEPAADKLLDGIVMHEQHFWGHRFAAANDGDDIAQAEFREAGARCVAALTLRGGAATPDEAEAINRSAKGPSQKGWVRFLESLYPGRPDDRGTARYIAGLEPDLLGEELVARVLADVHTPPTYLADVCADSKPPALHQAFVVLGRLSLRDERALGWMERLLTEDVNARAPAAFLAAMTLGRLSAYAGLGRILAEQLEHSGTAEVAGFIEGLAPEQTVSLREVCAWATRRLLDALPADSTDEANLKERAGLLNNLGNRLSDLGCREEALAASQEAVDIRRRLAATRPDAFLPYLATSLNNLGNRLRELGRREEALAATQEAAEHYRKLAATRPDAFRPDLAMSLNNLGNSLSELGQREEALAVAREAVQLYLPIAAAVPARYLRECAIAARSLLKRCEESGLDPDAEPLLAEAAALIARFMPTEGAGADAVE